MKRRAVFFNENNDIIGIYDDEIIDTIDPGETGDFQISLSHSLFPCDIHHYKLMQTSDNILSVLKTAQQDGLSKLDRRPLSPSPDK